VVGVVVLLDLYLIVLKPEHGSLVVVDVAVVGRAEYCYDCGKLSGSVPLMQLVAVHLDLVRPHHAEEVVVFEEVVGGLDSEQLRAVPLGVPLELLVLVAGLVLDGVRPH